MTDSVRQVWIIPTDWDDMAPTPALIASDGAVSVYRRQSRVFSPFFCREFGVVDWDIPYDTFDECRAAMMKARAEALAGAREHVRELAVSIEHIRTIPAASFPNVSREVPEAQQQKAEEQEEAQGQEEVNPAIKRPARKPR